MKSQTVIEGGELTLDPERAEIRSKLTFMTRSTAAKIKRWGYSAQ
jgi:hypothetical protein